MSILIDHLAAVEGTLLAKAQVQSVSGHSLHKGNPRETFIRDFLKTHISEKVSISTGEIVNANSQSGEQRNQHDVVIFRREYPKLNLGDDHTYAFLVESVVATIEVKSTLTKADLRQAFKAAKATKDLGRGSTSSLFSGYQPPAVLNYVVAYDGPASMATVYGWLHDIHGEMGIGHTPLSPQHETRQKTSAPALDGVFILGKGFLAFDNMPLTFLTDEERQARGNWTWVHSDIERGALLLLFTFLTVAIKGMVSSSFNPAPYLSQLRLPKGASGGPGV